LNLRPLPCEGNAPQKTPMNSAFLCHLGPVLTRFVPGFPGRKRGGCRYHRDRSDPPRARCPIPGDGRRAAGAHLPPRDPPAVGATIYPALPNALPVPRWRGHPPDSRLLCAVHVFGSGPPIKPRGRGRRRFSTFLWVARQGHAHMVALYFMYYNFVRIHAADDAANGRWRRGRQAK
jgi:hypothetical protein